jgi:hypothetical protein
MINADKPTQWKTDIATSVDLFNTWFIEFAPETYRNTRAVTTASVEEALGRLNDMRNVDPATIRQYPSVVPVLRMSTAPPIARDRLIGLAQVPPSLVLALEQGTLPSGPRASALDRDLSRICDVITRLLDSDIFPWLAGSQRPTEAERYRASTIVADRLCSAVANPIIRNAQEQRQLALIGEFLTMRAYRRHAHPTSMPITEMEPGTYSFRQIVVVGTQKKVNIPVDVVVQPKSHQQGQFPILIEAKSAGDFTNTNKRRKEEATKLRQLRDTYGDDIQLILFLCGYFDSGYLGYEAAEGLDWVWEHRIDDLLQLDI